MTNEKHFPKNISQWEFDFGLFTNLPIIIVARDFSPSFSLFLWLFLTKYVSNLKTTCHVKLKIFSWTKLLENLLLFIRFTGKLFSVSFWESCRSIIYFINLDKIFSPPFFSNYCPPFPLTLLFAMSFTKLLIKIFMSFSPLKVLKY